jgi:hypothetical protein
MTTKKDSKPVEKPLDESGDGREKRYCKGCLCDVTQTMFCYCGEFYLSKESTYTDDDLKNQQL